MSKKQIKGFTMVELLVAMAIIGLLIAAAIWGISIAQQNARNTQRREVGAQLLAAMSEYYGRYNVQPVAAVTATNASGETVIRFQDVATGTPTRTYDVAVSGVGVPIKVDSVTVSAPANFWQNAANTYYSVLSTTNGYKVCVGLEGSSASYANLSEKPNLVSCP